MLLAARRAALLLVLMALASAGVAAQEPGRSLHWRELAVDARLDGAGGLHVREAQRMVFNGTWNGGERVFDLRFGQELELHGVTRVDPSTGERTPLRPGELEAVDEFERDGSTVRWRSRLPSDPPFQNQKIVYELDYTIAPVVMEADGGGYALRHDFAFADRAGVIEHFRVSLMLDTAWASPGGRLIEEEAAGLAPGRGYTVSVPLDYVAPGRPSAVAFAAPPAARALVAIGALLVPVLVFLGLRRRDRELDAVAPHVPAREIDEEWLEAHIFTHPAEIVGASWDRKVGPAEVAALLARLVAEGKLASEVREEDGDSVLHLRRVASWEAFAPHERELLEGLFFDGSHTTDTAAVREHYKSKGFDPAAVIRSELMGRLEALPGAGKVERRWWPAAAVVLVGAVLAMSDVGLPGGAAFGVVGLFVALLVALFGLGSAGMLSSRVAGRTGPRIGVLLPITSGAALLVIVASGALEGEAGLLFYRPDAGVLFGQLIVLTGLGLLAVTLARPGQTPERLAFRRRLVSARNFFAEELGRPEPRLQDAWFPYLLAFGLGPEIDRWFGEFGTPAGSGADNMVILAAGGVGQGSSSGSGGWSGGGAQFGGGGGFGGGGAGGSWSVAAAGLAAGVAAPSSSGSGGGGAAASGGGGGGGW